MHTLRNKVDLLVFGGQLRLELLQLRVQDDRLPTWTSQNMVATGSAGQVNWSVSGQIRGEVETDKSYTLKTECDGGVAQPSSLGIELRFLTSPARSGSNVQRAGRLLPVPGT